MAEPLPYVDPMDPELKKQRGTLVSKGGKRLSAEFWQKYFDQYDRVHDLRNELNSMKLSELQGLKQAVEKAGLEVSSGIFDVDDFDPRINQLIARRALEQSSNLLDNDILNNMFDLEDAEARQFSRLGQNADDYIDFTMQDPEPARPAVPAEEEEEEEQEEEAKEPNPPDGPYLAKIRQFSTLKGYSTLTNLVAQYDGAVSRSLNSTDKVVRANQHKKAKKYFEKMSALYEEFSSKPIKAQNLNRGNPGVKRKGPDSKAPKIPVKKRKTGEAAYAEQLLQYDLAKADWDRQMAERELFEADYAAKLALRDQQLEDNEKERAMNRYLIRSLQKARSDAYRQGRLHQLARSTQLERGAPSLDHVLRQYQPPPPDANHGLPMLSLLDMPRTPPRRSIFDRSRTPSPPSRF